MIEFTGIKVFSATLADARGRLGDVATDWMKSNPRLKVVDRQILQSSDNAFHCLTIMLFYTGAP